MLEKKSFDTTGKVYPGIENKCAEGIYISSTT
jgi:hypothetical protein